MDYIIRVYSKYFRPAKIFKKIKEIFNICNDCQINFFSFLILAMRAYFKGGFRPKELYTYGLLGSKFSNQNLAKYCSKRKMLKIQASLNPKSWQDITANKAIFYKYCQASNIPIPKLYGLFFKNTAGWSFTGSILSTKNDWIKFFNSETASEFVIKPAIGAYGDRVRLYIRSENGSFRSLEDRFNAIEIYEDLKFDRDYESFVIQERLKSHPDIIQFGGSENLQTVRMNSFIDKYGNFHILYATFKPIVGKNVTDNFDSGRTGNLLAKVAVDTGALEFAMSLSQDVCGPKIMNRHPITGFLFEGFRLPLWEEACSLVKKAAFKFLPKRTIGWDVAITQKGVYILEANGRYDPPVTHQKINEFLSYLIEN
jgi:hypothetical protein